MVTTVGFWSVALEIQVNDSKVVLVCQLAKKQ
jgi:hypothetical protein